MCVEENADAPVQIIGLENRFITHGSVPELLRECGLTPEQLADRIEEIAGDKESKSYRIRNRLTSRWWSAGWRKSREKAQALVMSGVVYIGENKVDKASTQVTPEDELIVRQTGTGYVSRGALKLEKRGSRSSAWRPRSAWRWI